MHKCPKCGTEFEGNFCPECGEKWLEEKTCPSCGATLSGNAKFCNVCGYSFFAEPDEAKTSKSESSLSLNLFGLLRYVPTFAALLFAVLMFAFYAAPVASVILGAGLPNESMGNVYSMQSGILSEIPELKATMITLIVFAVAFLALAEIAVLVKIKGSEKANKRVFFFPYAIYLLSFIMSIVIMAYIGKEDGGMGIIGVGACPILIMVFALLFAAISGGATFARSYLGKKKPELVEAEAKRAQEKDEAERSRVVMFYATHHEPLLKGTSKREIIEYRHRRKLYNHAKEGEPNKAVVWLEVHKALFTTLCVIVIMAILGVTIVVPIVTNNFATSKVSKIQLGDSPEQVRKLLGDPSDETEYRWKYYDKKYNGILNKLEKNGEEQEKALTSGSLSKLASLAAEEEKLQKQLDELEYSYIEIEFEKDEDDAPVVSTIFLDKNRCNSREDNKKEVEKVKTLSENKVGYYVDNTGSEPKTKIICYNDNNLNYETHFSDKSYYKAKITNGNIENKGNGVVLKWVDRYASYEFSDIIKIGEITENGVWQCNTQAKSLLLSLTIPDNVKAIGDNTFEDCGSLKEITIPSSVTKIGKNAFGGCSELESIVVDGNAIYEVKDNCLIEKATNKLIRGCKNSKIPDSVTSIGEYAFADCSSLTEIIIPESVKTIGDSAFEGCGLIEITIPKSVTSIGRYAFVYCDNLTSVIFKITEGWSAGSKSISSLQFKSTAAQYLTTDYSNKEWIREK